MKSMLNFVIDCDVVHGFHMAVDPTNFNVNFNISSNGFLGFLKLAVMKS